MLYYERKASRAGFQYIAGVDEAGRGPLAGPVVAASIILKETRFNNRVDDSKKLTPKMRFFAYKEILSRAWVGIGIISQKVIDRVNIYNATRMAMEEAIDNLAIKPDCVLVDGHIRLRVACEKTYLTNGDQNSLSIAGASIIAKVTRDNIMRKYHKKYPQYGFSRHKGYGTKEHILRLFKHGPSPIHRRTFNPIKQLLIPRSSSK